MKFKVGDRIRLKKDSKFKHQSKGGYGIIIDIRGDQINHIVLTSFPYVIRWEWQSMETWCYPEGDIVNGFIYKYIKKHYMT